MAKPLTTERQKLLQELIDKYPEAGNRTLARLAVEFWPHEFLTIESTRSAIRGLLGACGTKDRRSRGIKEGEQTLKPHCSIKIPEGLKQTKPTAIFDGAHKWLLISDLHVPYHAEDAIEAAVRQGVDEGCDALCVNGDAVDFYKLSNWSQDPRMRNPDQELAKLREVLQAIVPHFPGPKVYKCGNHEERYERYLHQRAPALVGIADFELDKVLKLNELGFEFVASRQHYRLGKLNVFHGHELPRGLTDPVNVGRGVWLRVREAAIVGHWHRTSTHLESAGVSKQVTTCYSVGCLCDLTPAFATINSWTHGFALVDIDAGGHWNVSNRTYASGRVYRTE